MCCVLIMEIFARYPLQRKHLPREVIAEPLSSMSMMMPCRFDRFGLMMAGSKTSTAMPATKGVLADYPRRAIPLLPTEVFVPSTVCQPIITWRALFDLVWWRLHRTTKSFLICGSQQRTNRGRHFYLHFALSIYQPCKIQMYTILWVLPLFNWSFMGNAQFP